MRTKEKDFKTSIVNTFRYFLKKMATVDEEMKDFSREMGAIRKRTT